MKITYNRVEEPQKNNCFEVEFCFEHGDADSSESYFITLKDMAEEEFVNYIQKVDEVSGLIKQSRSTGKTLPGDFEEKAQFNNRYIPVELDAYAKMHMSDYYADMGVGEIYYYNADGIKHKVSIST